MGERTGRIRASVLLAEQLSARTAAPILISVALCVALGQGWPLAVAAVLSLMVTLLVLARVDRPRSYVPTMVTGLRACITCCLIGFAQGAGGGLIAAGILTVFALDGLDGYLARRLHSASVLGARLDMETDAVLVMGACTLLYLRGEIGAWVLASGLLRYVYVLLVRTLGARGEAPRSNVARYSFAVALTGLTQGFLPAGMLSSYGPALATAVLFYSFGRSFYWSLRVQ